jgi:trk system potassium uptake protein TrkH
LKRGMRFSPSQVVALTFVGLILTGTVLLMLPISHQDRQWMAFVDALFTATSASCVTGLVVVDTGTYFSLFGQIVLIALIQLGGLGLMLFATLFSVAMGRRINLQDRMIIQASLNQNDMSGVVRMCLRVAKYTASVEGLFGTLLAVRFYPLYGLKGIYYGYWHAISAFCNAGFDLFGHYSSLTAYVTDPWVNGIISILIILGGIGFTVMTDVLEKKNFSRLHLHSKLTLATTVLLLVIGTVLIKLMEFDNAGTLGQLTSSQQWLASFFQSVSTRTAGFNTVDLNELRVSTMLLMIMLMVIGASPASTGGGIKTTTAAVLVLSTRQVLKQEPECVIFGRRIDHDTIFRAFAITTLSITWMFLAVIGITCLEDVNFLNAMFEVTSAYATVGLSTGLSQHICTGSKLILALSMYAGRVGIMTFAMALTVRKQPSLVRYPEEKILIG